MADPAPMTLPLGTATVAYRVNTEIAPFLGGGRALLLQVAHPKVAAGVEQHSTYASDPWGRLYRTLDVMLKLAFGPPHVSARQQRLLARIHSGVRGTTAEGATYDARDPELLLWVWATLVDTARLCHERVFGALPGRDLDRYLVESTLVAEACGVPAGHCPRSWGEFADYVDSTVRTQLRATSAGLAVARATMDPPLPEPLSRVVGVPLRLVTAGLLPPSLRAEFGFAWDDARERRLGAFFACVRAGARITPRAVRTLPARSVIRSDQSNSAAISRISQLAATGSISTRRWRGPA